MVDVGISGGPKSGNSCAALRKVATLGGYLARKIASIQNASPSSDRFVLRESPVLWPPRGPPQ